MTRVRPVAVLLAWLATACAAEATDRTVAGWVETGWIGAPGQAVGMKLDTGARTSSINAQSVVTYDRDGVRHVRFTLTLEDGRTVEIFRPVVRMAAIRRAGTAVQTRPVIRLALCVAGVTGEAEFTLADREDMTYPVLVGRAFLADRLLVDPGAENLAPGRCGP